MLPLLLALTLAQPAASRSTRVVSGLTKIRPGALPSGTNHAQLSLARGECEGFQVVVTPPLAKVRVRAEPLRAGGAQLRLRLFREAFIAVETPSNGQGARGLWPDPLVPITDAVAVDSTPERPLLLYAEVCASSDQSPGNYRGGLVVDAEGRAPERVDVAAQVQAFTLPATSSLPNSFGLSIYSLAKGHGLDAQTPAAQELLRKYATSLLEHRLSAYGMGIDPPPVRFEGAKAIVDFTAYDRELGPFLDGTALPSGARFTTTDVRESKRAATDEQKAAYYAAVREHFRQKQWPALLFFYAKDEPKPADYPLVLTQARRVQAAKGIPLLVTSPFEPLLQGAADILCPTLNCFFPRPGAQTCARVVTSAQARRQLKPGAKLWWYQSCNSHGCDHGPFDAPEIERAYTGWASYMVDHPAPANRAMGVLAFSQQIDGELYFDTVYAYNQLDPWQSVWAFGGNGDGTLFYPGTPKSIGGAHHVPVESLRLKQIRDGLEDYEYLRLLAASGEGAFAQSSAKSLAASGFEISLDVGKWETARRGWSERLARRAQP